MVWSFFDNFNGEFGAFNAGGGNGRGIPRGKSRDAFRHAGNVRDDDVESCRAEVTEKKAASYRNAVGDTVEFRVPGRQIARLLHNVDGRYSSGARERRCNRDRANAATEVEDGFALK